ncbi:MAG: alpha/beta hydrolase [Gordonia sp. (in: high G+C Gram-positive bacteria)]
MKHVATSFGQVAYESTGDGPPVVLLHATLHDHHDFDAVAGVLATRHRVLAIDWPGHGQSAPAPAITADGLATVLVEILAALDVGPAVFVGNSVGGYAAARLAIEHPGLVQGLVLVNTGGFSPQNAQSAVFCRTLGTKLVARAVARAVVSAYLRPRSESDRALGERVVGRIRTADGTPTFTSLWRSFNAPSHDLRARASAITAPTLVIWGVRDRLADASWGRTANQLIAGSRYVELDTGHVAFASDPESFLAVAEPFIESAIDAAQS